MDPADPHNLHDTPTIPFWKRSTSRPKATIARNACAPLREPLTRIAGVKEVNADPATERVWITFDARKTHAPALHDAILRSGYKPAATAD